MSTSNKIKQRLQEAGDRFWAGDNISAHIYGGEKQLRSEERRVGKEC